MKITYHTINNTVTLTVKKNQVVISSRKPVKRIEFDACMVFDCLKDGLSTRSKYAGIRRRAKQLNGLSIQDACK